MVIQDSGHGAMSVAQEAKPSPAVVVATGEPRMDHTDHLH